MTKTRYYRFKARPAVLFDGAPDVRLQVRTVFKTWHTVNSLIAFADDDPPMAELIMRAKCSLWAREAARLERAAYWAGQPAPKMVDVDA